MFLFIAITFGLASCEYDNYEAPNVHMSGRVTYNGVPLQVRNNEVTFFMYEPGWELSASTYMTVQVSWNGTFNAEVYGGKTYKLIRQANIGPWVNPTTADTITVTNYHGEKIDMPVTPYYILQNVGITMNDSTITGTCTATDIAGTANGRTIEKVGLYVSRNILVDNVFSNLGHRENISVTPGSTVNLSVSLKGKKVNSTSGSLPSTGKVYARLGLKVAGITAMIYSEPFELTVH